MQTCCNSVQAGKVWIVLYEKREKRGELESWTGRETVICLSYLISYAKNAVHSFPQCLPTGITHYIDGCPLLGRAGLACDGSEVRRRGGFCVLGKVSREFKEKTKSSWASMQCCWTSIDLRSYGVLYWFWGASWFHRWHDTGLPIRQGLNSDLPDVIFWYKLALVNSKYFSRIERFCKKKI